MSEERRYYIENAITEDKWLTYAEAHLYGCTKKKPIIYTLYALHGESESQSLEPVIVRKDIDTNTYYDTTIAPPHEWVDNISTLGLYKKIGNITLYMGEQELPYVGYTSDINSNTADYVQNTYGGLTPVEDLYYSQGITDHKCNNYYIQDGVVYVWYDPETHLYWDRQPGRYHWTGDPPRTDQQESNYIPVFTDPILPHPQWENDLSQLPEFYRSYGVFEPTHTTVGLITTFKDWDQWELESKSLMWTRDGKNHVNYQPTVKYITFDESEQFPKESPNTPLYTDVLKTGIPIYVIDVDGVEDAGGVHRDYGYAFTGDYEYVWVESDADVDLFQGTSRIVVGQSHDDENPVLYYISYQYYTPTEVHSFGYTFTKGEDIEIWDSNLLYKYQPQELVVSFVMNNNGSSYNLNTGTTYWAFFIDRNLQKNKCEAIGLTEKGMATDHTFEYSNKYTYEITNIYSDIGTRDIRFDPTDFTIEEDVSNHVLKITTSKQYTGVCTWRLRIYPPIEIYLHLKESGSTPIAVTFDADQKYWAELQSNDDRQLIINNGFSVIDDSTLHGEVGWNQDYTYTPLSIYSDINSENLVTDDMSNFVVEQYGTVACIKAIAAFTIEVMTWKLLMQRTNKQYIDVLVACKYDPEYPESFRLVNFSSAGSSGTNWYAEVTNEHDKLLLQSYNYFYPDTSWGLYGETIYNSSCSYRVMEFYSDVGRTKVDIDTTKFAFKAGSDGCIVIYSTAAFSSIYVKTYRLRIYLPTV